MWGSDTHNSEVDLMCQTSSLPPVEVQVGQAGQCPLQAVGQATAERSTESAWRELMVCVYPGMQKDPRASHRSGEGLVG